MNKIKRLLLSLIILTGCTLSMQAQMLALKTDVVADAMFIPNLNAELVVGNKASINLSAMYAYRPFLTDTKAFALSPEFRYWFGGRPLSRWFAGASLVGSSYKIFTEGDGSLTNLGKSSKGNVWGFGVTFGYVWKLGKKNRWSVELCAGLGAYRYKQLSRFAEFVTDEYGNEYLESGEEHAARDDKFTERGWAILPYKLGASFIYVIPTEAKKKK